MKSPMITAEERRQWGKTQEWPHTRGICPICGEPLPNGYGLVRGCKACKVDLGDIWYIDPFALAFIDFVKLRILASKLWHANQFHAGFRHDYPRVVDYVRMYFAAKGD